MLELGLSVIYGIIAGLLIISSILIINRSKGLINITASFTAFSYAIYSGLRAIEEFFNDYYATLSANIQTLYTFMSYLFFIVAPLGLVLSMLIVINGEIYIKNIYFWLISLIYVLINITIWISSFVFSYLTVNQGNALFNFFPILPLLLVCFELIIISKMAIDLKSHIYLLIIGIFIIIIGFLELTIANIATGLDIFRSIGYGFLIVGAFIGMFAFLTAKQPNITENIDN